MTTRYRNRVPKTGAVITLRLLEFSFFVITMGLRHGLARPKKGLIRGYRWAVGDRDSVTLTVRGGLFFIVEFVSIEIE
jgi:hypothetical protein